MMKKHFLFTVLLFLCLVFAAHAAFAGGKDFSDRGRYVYDEASRLPFESELALSSYLWKIDAKTDYEIVLVFPKTKLDEKSIIDWFNANGVGKKGKDTGAAIFIFSDNSVFVAIGSGNDKVSVAYSKTEGERILKDLEKEPALAILRFVNALGKGINEPTLIEMPLRAGEVIKANIDVILFWALVLSLIVFLIQQINGFQKSDLIAPLALLVITGMVIGGGLLADGERGSFISEEYGVVTSSKLDEYHYVTPVYISTGKSTTVIYVPHTDYINRVTCASYDFKSYGYKFVSTDSKSAWDYKVGVPVALSVNVKDAYLVSAGRIYDNSGGKTIGDGVWINVR